jgi:hypothetical protein
MSTINAFKPDIIGPWFQQIVEREATRDALLFSVTTPHELKPGACGTWCSAAVDNAAQTTALHNQ